MTTAYFHWADETIFLNNVLLLTLERILHCEIIQRKILGEFTHESMSHKLMSYAK